MKRFLKLVMAYIVVLAIAICGLNQAFIVLDKGNVNGVDKFKAVPAHVSICNTGNSHGLYGFCYEKLENCENDFNLALSSQSPYYDYQLLKEYEDRIDEGTVVLLTVSYFSFYGFDETDEADFESKNVRYYGILPDNVILGFDSEQSFWSKWPLLTSYQRVPTVLLGLSHDADEEYWNSTVEDEFFIPDGLGTATRHVGENIRDDSGEIVVNQQNLNAIYDMIDLCKSKNARVILITPPYSDVYNQGVDSIDSELISNWKVAVESIAESQQIEFYNYSRDDRFQKEHQLFINSDHLNKTGAIKFTQIVYDEVINAK